MELRQIYEQMQGDYDSVMGRLCTEERVKKYLLKFLDKDMDKLIIEALNCLISSLMRLMKSC